MNNMYCVYKIVNPNNQIYIGATNNFKNRMHYHKYSKYAKNNTLISKSINEYGFDTHSIEILWSGSNKDEMYSIEKYYIKKMSSCYLDGNNGLNSRRSNYDNEHLKLKMGHSTPIFQYNLISGEFIKGFDTIHQASESIGKKGAYKNISSCANNKRRYAYSYYWSFSKLDFYKPEKSWKNKKLQKVYKLFKDGTIIQDVYNSISEAASKNNVNSLDMFRCISFNRVLNNSIFIKQS